MSSAQVDIVVVSFNALELLRACLESTCRCAPDAHVVVVDNASREPIPTMVRGEFPHVTCIALDENIGFGAANNRGVAAGRAPFILFLNPDAELRPGALETLRATLNARHNCAIAGPKLIFPDGSFQASCRRLPTPLRSAWNNSGMAARIPNHFAALQNWLREGEHARGREVEMLSGACFLVRRAWMEEVGGFDEKLFMYEEETHLALAARARGLHVYYNPDAIVIHHGGGATAASGMSVFSQRHLFRSKYVCFRENYSPVAARIAYLGDRVIFGLSAFHQKLRRRAPIAAATLAQARRAWRESSIPMRELRSRPDFFRND